MTTFRRLFVLVPVLLLASSAIADATPASPGWTLDPVASPTHFLGSEQNPQCREHVTEAQETHPCDTYEVVAMNAGSAPTDGTPVTLSDSPPPGVTVKKVQVFLVQNPDPARPPLPGELPGQGATEGVDGSEQEGSAEHNCVTAPVVRCTYPHALAPDDWLLMKVFVTVDEGTSGALSDKAEVSGGGAPSVSGQLVNTIGSGPPPFGASRFDFFKDGLSGGVESQAGGHPYELTTTIDLNDVLRNQQGQGAGHEQGYPSSVEDLKDVVVDLPLGFAGSTLAAPQCTEAQLNSEEHCPADTVVGHLTSEPNGSGYAGGATINSPIWNVLPEYGHPAEFGYIDSAKDSHVAGYVSVVPTPAGYVLRFVASDIPQVVLSRIVVTFYGNPEARDGAGLPQIPFFTNPTACSGSPQVATVWMDSWTNPARFQPGGLVPVDLQEPQWAKTTSESPPAIGCNQLSFTPQIGAQPTTHEADKPTGLEFEQRLPQSEVSGGDATPALKNTTITFPEGMTVDPSSADGLGACTNAQIGWEGPTLFDFTQAPPECPESSKIGTLELETPLIPGVLHGEVFLAAQNENPFHSTFATYIVVNDPVTGVVLKLAGELKSDPATGRLTAVFDETPELPFSALKVHFFGGPRAELATPPVCGTYTTTSELSPWSIEAGELPATPFDSYVINEDCATGFAPTFSGGSTNLQAGAFTTFEASFSREDDDQELAGLTVNLPPGLLANVGSVPLCGQAEVKAEEHEAPGGCPVASQVGTVQAGAGPGPNPLFVSGKVFLTGPYNGGPYGLAVVVSANPGPFHFGNVVVRQSLRIDPIDSHVTDVSDPFPTFLDPVGANGQTDGIPIKLRRVDVLINRPGFTFNPTNCSKLALSAAITSTGSAISDHSVPFQVTNCAHLKYTPTLTVSTAAKASRSNGSSLFFKIAYPKNSVGSQSWMKEMKFVIPKQLPARLTTLQKACLAHVFETERQNCPAASIIGHVLVHTPVLAVPVEGPLYFVSYGGAAFPDAVAVLHGSGITIESHGHTLIKGGVTSATFESVPDVPFESIEVTVPQGKYSEFGANLPHERYDFCGQHLKMPILFKAQNGMEIHAETPVGVTGCPKARTKAQLLATALKACHKKHGKKRAACERAARKAHGARAPKRARKDSASHR